MLSELLGELNVSHTGGRYRPGAKEATASLGLLYDWNYTGKGMKVDEVVEKRSVRPENDTGKTGCGD